MYSFTYHLYIRRIHIILIKKLCLTFYYYYYSYVDQQHANIYLERVFKKKKPNRTEKMC